MYDTVCFAKVGGREAWLSEAPPKMHTHSGTGSQLHIAVGLICTIHT